MNVNSTIDRRPDKPYPGYPLYPHKTGRWAKKIRGKTEYFGPWGDHQAALATYLAQKDDLEAGRRPVQRDANHDALTVQQLVILFLEAKKLKVQSKDIVPRTWKEYEAIGKRMIRVFGAKTAVESLMPSDFGRLRADFQRTHKRLTSIKGDLAKVRLFFNWAGPGTHGQHLIDRLPKYGEAFRPPPQRALDREREESEERVLTPEQIHALLAKAEGHVAMKAMMLMGVNCGYGNTDLEKLKKNKLDLDGGWIEDNTRHKTGVRRRNPLWKETILALREALALPRLPECAKLVFVTRAGKPFKAYDVTHEFEKLAVLAGQQDADFYDLRRTCNTIGVEACDDDAVRTIMGHKRSAKDETGVYNRKPVGDDRLLKISKHIHDWLFKAVVKAKSAKQVPPSSENLRTFGAGGAIVRPSMNASRSAARTRYVGLPLSFSATLKPRSRPDLIQVSTLSGRTRRNLATSKTVRGGVMRWCRRCFAVVVVVS